MMDDRTSEPLLREVMACLPTGVTVVAACDTDGEPYGLTVSSFTSVSLEPPLVLVCIGHRSSSHDRLVGGDSFSINLLSAEQEAVALRFAREPSQGRFDDVDWAPSPSGAPILAGTTAWIDCCLGEVLTAGDHSILLGRVESSGLTDRPALVFHRGRMGSTGA